MSEDQNNNKNKPLKNGNPERFQPKVLFIWLGIFALMIALYMITEEPKAAAQEWSLGQVLKAVEEGRVTEGVLKPDPSGGRDWTVVRGKIITDEVVGDASEFIAKGQLTDKNLELLQESGLFNEEPASTAMRDLLYTLLPFLFIIAILYFLFIRQIRQAGRGAMSFGKSKAKMLTRDKDKVTFKDVAGCEEAKEEVSEVIEFLKDPKKFQKIGGRIPKGALLVGPPGTGKTLLARAIAGEADVPFFSISGSDFVEMFVGVGAARVRDMFEQGRKNAPCLVFIDEIDAVGRQRGAGLGGGNDEREQTLNSLLVEMDGFEAHEGVIIIAATNRPDVLDSALLRPGRFDRQITIDLPDLNGREEILAVHAEKVKTAEDLDLARVARATVGFSGADLANLLNESALLAARHDKEEVTMAEVEEAHDKIRFGRERSKLMDDEDKEMTAYHEAGHALIQALLKKNKYKLHKVTIIPRGRALGLTMSTPTKDILGQSKKELLDNLCMTMGGRIGEEVITGDYSNGASGDIKQATQVARHMVCDWGMSDLGPVAFGENQDTVFLGKEISRNQNYSEATAKKIDEAIHDLIQSQFDRAEKLIIEHKEALIKIADLLLEYETIDGKHVYEVLEHGEVQSEIVRQPSGLKKDREPELEAGEDSSNQASSEETDLPPASEPQLA